ncbi:hypothetical protein BJY00DRAFT_310001 [Aspergillus carlsbadensis]|nr:hypothetical protein BJY00DRAFT_310001 [Aspergillus carlsbadensis]
MDTEMETDPDLDLDLDKQIISQFQAAVLARLEHTTGALKRMTDAAAIADNTEESFQSWKAGFADATSSIEEMMGLLGQAQKMRDAQRLMTRDGPSDYDHELMTKIMLLKPALARMMKGNQRDEDLDFCQELITDLKMQQPVDPENAWEPQEALNEGEMGDDGDGEGTKRGLEDEESQDESKRRRLD